MDVERLVVTLMADASQYSRVLTFAELQMVQVAENITASVTKMAVGIAVQLERAAIAFEVMFRSAERGRKVMEDLVQMAIETPFHTTQLVKGGRMLAAFGFEAEEVVPTLHALGEAASATGVPLDRLVLAFGQVRTAGRLLGQELRQFTNAGIPMAEMLAVVTGKPTEVIRKMVREGQIGYPEVVAAFNKMTQAGGLYAGMMDRINRETVSGRWENFSETLQIFSGRFAEGAFAGLKLRDVLGYLSDNMTLTKENQRALVAEVAKFFDLVYGVGKEVVEMVRQVAAWADRNRELLLTVGGVVVGMMAWTLVLRTTAALLTLIRFTVLATLSPFKLLALGAFALGFALNQFEGVTLAALSENLQGVVKLVSSWMENNRELVEELGKVAAAIAVVYGLTKLFMAVYAALVAVKVAIALAFTPLGAGVLLGAGVIVLLEKLGAFKGVLAEMTQGWEKFLEVLPKAGEGIMAAIKVGDVKAAWEIVTSTMELGWRTMLVNLEAMWIRFTRNLTKPTGSYDLAMALVEAEDAASRSLAWTRLQMGTFDKGMYDRQIAELNEQRVAELANLKQDQANAGWKVDQATREQVDAMRARYEPELKKLRDKTAGLADDAINKAKVVELMGGKGYLDVLAQTAAAREKLGTAGAFHTIQDVEHFYEVKDGISSGGTRFVPKQVLRPDIAGMVPQLSQGAGPGALGFGGLPAVLNQQRYAELLFKAEHDIQILRGAQALGNWDPESLKGLADTAKASKAQLDDFRGALEKTTVKIGDPLFKPFGLDPKAREAAEKLQLQFEKGVGPFDFFAREVGQYRGAAMGGAPGIQALVGGALGQHERINKIGGKPLLTPAEYDYGLFQAYEGLMKQVGGRTAPVLPPTLYAGTAAAQDVVNKNQNQTISVQEEVLKEIRIARYVQEEQREYMRQVAEVLKNQAAGEGLKPVGFGPGGKP